MSAIIQPSANLSAPGPIGGTTPSTGVFTGLTASGSPGTVVGKLKTDTSATTGLTAGVLSALTTASIVIYDSNGTAYRVPCVI